MIFYAVLARWRLRAPQCQGLVQFADESGKRAALLLHKTKLIPGAAISVLPSKFPALIVPPSTESTAQSVGNSGKAASSSDAPVRKHNPYLSGSDAMSESSAGGPPTSHVGDNAHSSQRRRPGLGYVAHSMGALYSFVCVPMCDFSLLFCFQFLNSLSAASPRRRPRAKRPVY